jgi:hypothetical protein
MAIAWSSVNKFSNCRTHGASSVPGLGRESAVGWYSGNAVSARSNMACIPPGIAIGAVEFSRLHPSRFDSHVPQEVVQ